MGSTAATASERIEIEPMSPFMGERRMKRRDFIALLGGAAVTCPLAARGQQASDRVWRIGVLVTGSPPHPIADALRKGLRDLGYSERRNVAFEVRYADGRRDRAAELAAELVRIGVDVIVANQTPAARAAKEATRTIPIVMAGVGAPLETGLVASLNRPGENITGITDLAAELGGKRLQLLRDIIPNLVRVAALASTHDLFTVPFLQYLRSAASNAGIQLEPIMVGGSDDFENAFATIARVEAQAVIVQGIFNPNRVIILDLAAKHSLPIMTWDRATTAAGGLISLSASAADIFQRASIIVDKVLKGAKPGDLPVEQPTTFELVINMKTAKVLRLTIPASIVVQATEVIE